jgi:nucleoside-diphosphate-sugar epimerase
VLPPVKKTVSPGAARFAGLLLEKIHEWFGRSGEPRMTRWLAQELSTAHWFDIGAAKRDLGYEPKVGLDEGMRRLAESLRAEARP